MELDVVQDSATVPTPAAGKVTLFILERVIPSLPDGLPRSSCVLASKSADGSVCHFGEMHSYTSTPVSPFRLGAL